MNKEREQVKHILNLPGTKMNKEREQVKHILNLPGPKMNKEREQGKHIFYSEFIISPLNHRQQAESNTCCLLWS